MLRARPWGPEDIARIGKIRDAITSWTKRITALLEPEPVKFVAAACPACGTDIVYRNDSAGERVRQPALKLVTGTGCTCQNCGTHWGPQLYLHLCRVLGFDMPAGVLE